MLPFHSDLIEAGVDESGRGPVLGRLYTAAVIWPKQLESLLVKDSKQISKSQMLKSYEYVINHAIAYYIDYATEEEIEAGILKANMASMHRSIRGLESKYGINIGHLIVDGNYFQDYKTINGEKIGHTTIVKGDSKYYSIAAASILAKWTRDKYIEDLTGQYPDLITRYDIKNNKGYLSLKHTQGLNKFGYCQFHRKSWKPFVDLPFNEIFKDNERDCNRQKIKIIVKLKSSLKL